MLKQKTRPARSRATSGRNATGVARRAAIATVLAGGPLPSTEIAKRTAIPCAEVCRLCYCAPGTFARTNPASCGSGARAIWTLAPKTSARVCRHCGKGNVNRPRGLCWTCYYAPGVKERYPSLSKYGRRGVTNFSGAAPLADVPTLAAPGTSAKIAVMTERAAAGRAVIHPADARFEGDPRPLEFMGQPAPAPVLVVEPEPADDWEDDA